MRMHWGAGTFLGVLWLSLSNCSSGYRDDCQAEVDCEGGNDADVDACVDRAKGQEDVADAYDCGDQFGEVKDCVEGKGVCENGRFTTKVDANCTAKLAALATCENAASAKKNKGDQ